MKLNPSGWSEFLSSLNFCEPPFIADARELSKSTDLHPEFKFALDTARKGNRALIFVLGEWGSGKTHQLWSYFDSSFREKNIVLYRSFFGVHTLEEAFAHLSTSYERLVGGSILLLLTYPILTLGADLVSGRLSSIASLAAVFSVVLSVIFYQSKWKIRYLVWRSLLALFGRGEKIVILDDIDRSSLGLSDRWALLASLWKFKHQYVVPLGFRSFEEKIELLEISQKLGGVVIPVEADAEQKYKLAAAWQDLFPFKAVPFDRFHWLNCLSVRDVLETLASLKENTSRSNGELRKLLSVHAFFRRLIERLGINGYGEREIGFPVHGQKDLRIEIGNSRSSPTGAVNNQYFDSFRKSIREDAYKHLYEIHPKFDKIFEVLFRERTLLSCEKSLNEILTALEKSR